MGHEGRPSNDRKAWLQSRQLGILVQRSFGLTTSRGGVGVGQSNGWEGATAPGCRGETQTLSNHRLDDLTIAMMAARIASGSSGQTASTAARSGSASSEDTILISSEFRYGALGTGEGLALAPSRASGIMRLGVMRKHPGRSESNHERRRHPRPVGQAAPPRHRGLRRPMRAPGPAPGPRPDRVSSSRGR